MVAASPVLPPPACTGSKECRNEGPSGSGSSDEASDGGPPLFKLLRSRGKSRAVARAPALLLAWAVAKAAWTATRSDF